jgi:hypothetical protein
VRTVSICVLKVKYDGREIPCNYTKPVYPDMSNVNKNITVEAKLISPPTYFVCQIFLCASEVLL